MRPFAYSRAADPADAVRLADAGRAKYLGGGTNLVDLMRETVEQPSALVDVTELANTVEETGGGLVIGAAARNVTVAENRLVRTRYPALSKAILAGRVEDGIVSDVRIALGGVAPKPWRAWRAEAAPRGAPATPQHFRHAADEELASAVPLRHNAFKVELAQRTITAVLTGLAGDRPS